MKILYFDDEPYISEALAESLTIFDCEVNLISEINDLFSELFDNPNKNDYDVLILDIMAPVPSPEKNQHVAFTNTEITEMEEGMNTGVILAKKIWEKDKRMPILFLSARELPESLNQFTTSYNFGYLRKPEKAETVFNKLKSLI